MGYIGNKPPQETIPADDAVTTAMLKDDAVTSAKIAGTTIVNADINASAAISNSKLETDPTNASNLSSGSVPLAQLGNAPETDTTGLENDIAILGFKVAANGSLSKYNLIDQTIDDFQDASGIDASASTDELRSTTGKYYSGGVSGTGSGGTETTYTADGNDYKIHSFLSTGTFTISGGTGNVDVLVVGGGGGTGGNDGNNGAGGGGGGGMREMSAQSMTEAVFDVTVGGSETASSVAYSSGAGSSFAAISGSGGGRGGGTTSGSAGGSGGGTGGYGTPAGGSGNAGGYTPSEGNDGGDGSNGGGGPPCPNRNGGGGGGAGAAGSNAQVTGSSSTGNGGAGGAGKANNWRTGVNVTYAGGGGGSGTASGGSGGSGGGGNAGSGYGATGTAGTANTGGGAGGGSHGTTGQDGGSGIVVLRYIDGAFVAFNDMTLVSNATTAEAVPTKGDLVMTYTNGAGTATVNTDIKGWVSRDDGTTYTQFTLADEGDTGGHTILTAHDLDISAQPSGSAMRYKITTHNQSTAKETRIQAVSLGWS